FIIDMDGVIYRGNTPLPGAREFVATLQAEGIPFLFLTNNSTRTPWQYVEKLAAFGIGVNEARVFTSSQATADYLVRAAEPGAPVYLIGEDGLWQAVTVRGFRPVERGCDASWVVVGMDTQLTYERLRQATLGIYYGARFVASNPDVNLPTEDGPIPGAGAIVAALEAASGVKAQVIGKPQPEIYRNALNRLGVSAQRTAAIGDRWETDILGGHNAGLITIGVLTGATTAEQFAQSKPAPDMVFPDLRALLQAWEQREA
ncbi:MAG TPA: HAD family hydrolase, partial [Anaerolineae bacterium]|nr:HAD family hydrolase [Anaerolineae bacterium]